jgi:hypothetical protein
VTFKNYCNCRTDLVGVAVMLQICIWEKEGSNLGRGTGYPDWSFSWFSLVPPCKCRDSKLLLVRTSFLSIDSIYVKFIAHNVKFQYRNHVNIELKAIFHAEFVDTFIIYLYTKFQIPNSNGSVVIIIKPRTKYELHARIACIWHVVVLRYTTRSSEKNKSPTFF